MILRPPRLSPRDVVRIVAPSGPVPRERFTAGAARLADRYRLRYDPAVLFEADGFLAGSDEHRLAALGTALADPEAKAIVMARGGYGLLRLLPFVDLAALRQHPKVLVGFSDGTPLLAAWARAGVASIHGPVVTQLPNLPAGDLDALFGMLEGPGPGIVLDGLLTITPGRVRGPLFGGNLEVLSRLLGTPYLPDLTGAVLVLEDVGERPYEIDRLITHLDLAGVFNAVSAVVVGQFTRCNEPPDSAVPSPTADAVLEERLSRLPIPVVMGGAFGHGDRNLPLPYGTLVELDTRQGTLVALEGAVS